MARADSRRTARPALLEEEGEVGDEGAASSKQDSELDEKPPIERESRGPGGGAG
jgi:hypothetical protein